MRVVFLAVFLTIACSGCGGETEDTRPLAPPTAPDTSETDAAIQEYAGELEKNKQSKK